MGAVLAVAGSVALDFTELVISHSIEYEPLTNPGISFHCPSTCSARIDSRQLELVMDRKIQERDSSPLTSRDLPWFIPDAALLVICGPSQAKIDSRYLNEDPNSGATRQAIVHTRFDQLRARRSSPPTSGARLLRKSVQSSLTNSPPDSQLSEALGFVNDMASSHEYTQEFGQLWVDALTCPISEVETSVTYNPTLEKKFDPVRRALLQCYRELRKSSFDLFNIEFAIWPASSFDAEIYKEGWSDIKFFAFKQGWADPHVLPVQVVIGLEGESYVLVKFNHQWQTFEEWMRTFLPSESDMVPPATYYNLGRFWNYNKKHFRFLDLPREVRDISYDYAMFPDGHHRVIPFHNRLPDYLKVYTPKEAHNLHLLRTNRQTWEESSKVLYGRAKFNFRKCKTVERFITGIRSRNFDQLRHVELCLTAMEFIDLFLFIDDLLRKRRLHPPYITLNPADFDIPCLGMWASALIFLKVRRLVLHFKHPADPSASSKEKFTPHGSFPCWPEFCQTKLVETCLNLARPFMYKPWDRIEISGYVKNGQRKRFFDSLPDYYDHMTDSWVNKIELPEDHEDGGVSIKGYNIPRFSHTDSEGTMNRVFFGDSNDPEISLPYHLFVYTR